MDLHPQPSTPTHREYYPQSYNSHTLKGPPATHPLPPTHRKNHPPSYNTHTPTILQHSHTKGTPAPHPLPPTHSKYHPPSYNTHTPTILQHSYTKGTHHPHPLPPTHRKYHPPSYNTHTPTPTPSEPVYYNFVLNLIMIPRNVYQDSQRAMLTYCHPVNLCTIN